MHKHTQPFKVDLNVRIDTGLVTAAQHPMSQRLRHKVMLSSLGLAIGLFMSAHVTAAETIDKTQDKLYLVKEQLKNEIARLEDELSSVEEQLKDTIEKPQDEIENPQSELSSVEEDVKDEIERPQGELSLVEEPVQDEIERPQGELSLVEERVQDELATSERAFVLTPHKVNYFLPLTYNPSPNSAPFTNQADQTDYELDEMEAKFQISFKFPLGYNVFGNNGHLFLAYTNQSYWQVYNQDISSPFRETSHEPEIFMLFNNDWQLGGFTNSFNGFGAVHQSNGKPGTLSRSWNRLYGTMIFDKGPYALAIKAWWRIPEDEKETPDSPKGDDNPDLTDYLGHMELTGVYGLDKHRFSLLLRNNFDSPNRGALELTWSYPIMGNLRFYTQYFNGYGESLIDYNHHNQRIGIGFSINDIL